MMKRMMALILCLLMVLVPVSCGKGDTTEATTTAATTTVAGGDAAASTDATTETTVPVEELEITVKPEYNGKLITVLCSGNWGYDEFFAEDVNGDPINDAKYTMCAMLNELMGIDLQVENQSGSSSGCTGKGYQSVTTSNLAGDHAYDFASIGTYDVSNLAYQGYLYDLNSLENIDLSKSWWDPKAQEQLEIDGRMFYTTGDAMVLDNNCTYCILFNKDLISVNNKENPYELVKNNQWTMDKMFELAANFGADLNGDGKLDDSDQYGILFWTDSGIGMIHGAGGRFGTIENGTDIVYTLNNERNLDILTRWLEARNDDNNYFITGSATTAPFTEGRSLFYTRYVRNIIDFRELDTNFGILPYPMYNAQQGAYYSMMHLTASCVSIPKSVSGDDLVMVNSMIEAMAYHSMDTLTEQYYEINLKTKGAKDEQSGPMIDKILSNRACDLSYYYQWGSNAFGSLASCLLPTGGKGVASQTKRFKSSIERSISQLQKAMDKFDQ